MSVRAFSAVLDTPASTTRNYLDKGTKPSTDYIERIAEHFDTVNIHWLITGQGGPFLNSQQGSVTQTGTFNQAGTKNKQTNSNSSQEGKANAALESANKEIALLREQLAMKDQLLAAKDEMLALLRGGYNRPN
jgi:hypothetical protein